MARRLAELPTEANIDLDPRLFNKVYMPMIFGEGGKIWIKPYNALYGGSGSGKSFSIGQMFAVHMTIMPGRNLVCLRKQKTDCIASCWAFVYNALRKFKLLQFWDVKVNPEHRMINRINGNEILFEGVDDIENIKSIQFTKKFDDVEGGDNLTDVWYEEVSEETDVEVIREIDRRLRDSFVNTRIVLSFNPVSRLHWLYDLVMHEWRMDGMDSYVLKTTYKDNKFLPASYGEKMERLKYTNPYAYQVYALGNWGVMGESVFNQNKIAERLRELQEKYTLTPYKLATFDYTLGDKKIPDPNTFKIRESRDGEIKIFVMPVSGRPYVCAVDTAGEGSDYYAAHVCDNVTGEEVAVYHSNKKPDICVWQVYGLCKMYNYALFCPESNFDSWPIHAFLMLDYPNMYRRMGATDKTHIRREDRYGFRTGVDNRQMMLTDMVSFTEHHMDLINDEDTLNEMLTFTRQEKKLKGIWWGAEAGAHDDLVMSYAIMLQARSQQTTEMVSDPSILEGYWTREELQDAHEEGRIDYYTMQEYIRTHDLYMESGEERNIYARKRVSRYAR